MATQTNNLVLIEAGVPRTLDATNDALAIGAATTFSKVLTVSSGGLAVTGDSSVLGNLTVTGDIVSRGTTNLLINDAIIDLATGNTGTVSTPGGFTVQMNRNSGFTAGTVTTFVAGVVATSNPTFTYTDATSSTLLVADDIVAISGSKVSSNDGLYAVYSVNQASFPQIVTIKGIGLNGTSTSTPFIQNQVTAGTGNTATACKIDLAVVLVADGTSAFTDGAAASFAKGTLITAYKSDAKDSDFTPNGAYSNPAAQTLQAAYNGGATITTASSTAIAITLTSGGFTVNGGGAVDLGSVGTDLSAFSVGTATMAVAATSTVDIQAAGAVTVDSSAGAISIGGDADSQAINIGTGAAARTITVGNITGATAVVVNAGTGASSVNVTGAGTFALVAGTGNIDLASNATDHTTVVGSVTGASAFTAQAGTGTMTHTAGGAYDVNAVGAVTIDSSTSTIGIGVDAVAQAINIGTGAAARAITVGNAASTSVNLNALAMTFTSVNALALTDGSATLQLGGTGATSLAGATTVDLDSSGAFSINSTAGAISIGGDADAQAINIGTGAAARTITVGNITGATAVVVNAGTGASSVNVTGAGTFQLVAGTGNIDLATNATDHATLVGSVTGVSAFTAQAGTGAMTHTAGGAYDVNAAGALTIDSSAGAISIGGDAVAQAINVGTGAAARTITVGNASGATSVVVNAGTGNIDIGTGAFARTTNIATGAAAQTVTIGSNNTTSTLDLKAGSGYINLQTWTKFKDTAGISVTAGETVTQGQAVYAKFDSATTRYFKASNNDVSDNARNVYGLCYTGGSGGDPVNLASVPGTVVSTALSGVGTADIGKTVYLGTGGALTLTAPTASATVFKVGYVHSNTGGVGGTGAQVFFQPQFISKIA